jgi:hypothetical protein
MIVIGGVGQLSTVIPAWGRMADKTIVSRGNRKKGVRRGSGVPYRHAHFGVSPCAHMRCGGLHDVCVPRVSRYLTAFSAIVVVVPAMKSTVMGTRTRSRRAILCRIRVLLQEKSVGSALCADEGPQLLDFSHIFRLTIRAKESGRCLCLKSSSCKMTRSSRRLPVALCRLGLLLAFCLCATVRVRCRAFGCRGQGPTREGSCASLLN